MQEGTVTSTIEIKKSVNLRSGWETVPVEALGVVTIAIPVITTEPWYASTYTEDDTLAIVGAGALVYFTGGLAVAAT